MPLQTKKTSEKMPNQSRAQLGAHRRAMSSLPNRARVVILMASYSLYFLELVKVFSKWKSRGSRVGFNALFRKTSVPTQRLLRRVPAWIVHPSGPRSLLLRVCACEALFCRDERHVRCGPSILRLLTQASLPCDPFCRSLRCVVCASETVYLWWKHVFSYFFSLLFPNQVFVRFFDTFPHFA